MDYLKFNFLNVKFIWSVLLLIAISWPIDGYGFDAGASCSEKTTRRGRAQLLRTIPCDLSRQAYCNLPGNMYPWNAVRRFVHENQGLMKRMYGDVRHISVLRTEINNNDIDVNDAEEAAARYSRSGWKRNKYIHSDSSKKKNSNLVAEAMQRRTSANRINTKSRNSSRASTAARTTASTSSSVTSTASTTSEPSTHLPAVDPEGRNANSSEAIDADDLDKEIVATVEEIFVQLQAEDDANTQVNNLLANITEKGDETTQSPDMESPIAPNLAPNKTEAATISTTLRIFGVTRNQEQESTTAVPPAQSADPESTTVTSRTTNATKNSTKDDDNLIKVDDDIEIADSSAAESTPDETIIDLNGKVPVKAENAAGQLFQDAAEKEEPILVSSRGVNACPVKEEVVAPFWANNTRGEVLALLNLYPFEQYVHWEKCTHEHKQMYCRDGCRCEQQYRLHRLLAYDPHNECRGIFSDWFRFPSCCICKCYDVPLEYRVTSRSPRSMGEFFDDSESTEKWRRHPIDEAEDEVHRAIYDHATNEWYRGAGNDDDDNDETQE